MKRGFTLVELLVVVLIIGILSAVAIPMYQGAVDKSHWSTMLPASKAIKDAQEAFKMTNGEYSDTMEHLDVQISNDDLTFTLNTPNNLADPNVIRVTNNKLGNTVRLASYLDDSPKFAGQLHCEAKNEGSTPNERGQRLCEKLLGGQELTEADGYTGYLLDQSIDQATCGNANRIWSKKQTHCYKTEQDRCTANGMPYANGFCGYQGSSGTDENNRLVIEEGAVCKGSWSDTQCQYLQVNAGGACVSSSNRQYSPCSNNQFNPGSSCTSTAFRGCNNSVFDGATCTGHEHACSGEFHNNSVCYATSGWACTGTFDSGSICYGDANYSCGAGTFGTGSKCIANKPSTCGSDPYWTGGVTYDGGCCEGTYCPSNAPKC